MSDQAYRKEPYSQEAEQAVLGAMLIKPELIDILSADLKETDFFFADNRAVFKAIMALRGHNRDIDFLTVGEYIGQLLDGSPAFAYTAELHKNTPSAANAKSYAQTVIARSIDRALVAACYTISEIVEGDGSAEDKIAQAQAEVSAINTGSDAAETVHISKALGAYLEELERREALGKSIDGLSTGIDALDAKIGGLKRCGLYIVAGRPKMGKTTLAMNWADHQAVKQKKQVLVFSQEMTQKQLIDKSLASLGGIPLNLLKDGSALKSHPKELVDTMAELNTSGMELYDRRGVTINRIRSVSRRHKMKHGLDAIYVDHIGLVDVDDARASTVQRISEITRALKLLAMELDVPVIALSQLNRELERRPDKRPITSDLRDSGSIEQDADAIFFVYRDEVYNKNTEFRGVAEFICSDARDFEAFNQKVRYQGKYSLFSDLSKDYEEPEPQPERSYSARSLLDEL
ncbi:MAG: replicative DNA helicase [Pseudomonas sp.]